MHSIVKNLSKVLALVVLSTNFSPSFVSATNPRHNPKAHCKKSKSKAQPKAQPKAKPVDAISADEIAFREQIKRFETLGEGQFKVDDDFKIQTNYKNATLMLTQLNDLFKKYDNVLKKLITYCKCAHTQFTLTRLVPKSTKGPARINPKTGQREVLVFTEQASVDICLRDMKLFVPPFVDDHISRSKGFTARVDDDKHLQAVVSHEFGHLMSFLKCLTDYIASIPGKKVELPTAEQLIAMYNDNSQEIRDAIEQKRGTAPYISHLANSGISPADLPQGAELTRSASQTVDVEYFAELFSYIECNSKAPADLTKAVHKIIDPWFKDDTPTLTLTLTTDQYNALFGTGPYINNDGTPPSTLTLTSAQLNALLAGLSPQK